MKLIKLCITLALLLYASRVCAVDYDTELKERQAQLEQLQKQRNQIEKSLLLTQGAIMQLNILKEQEAQDVIADAEVEIKPE